MTRAFGLFLLAVGVLASVVGGIGTVVAITELPRGGAGMLIAFALLDAFGIVMLVLGVVVMRRGKPIGAVEPPEPVSGHYLPNVGVEHELDGAPYTVHYTPPVKGKHAKPSVLTISTAVACAGEFQMTVETWFDKLCKRLGVAVEVQTGDQKFDDECYVRSDAPEFTAAYLADPVKRIAILDLRNFGFREVTLQDGKLWATWTGFNPATDHRDDLGADVAARLLLLARNLPAAQPEHERRTGAHRRFWQVALWVLLAGFALTAASLFAFPPVQTSELLLRALPVLLLGWPVFAWASAYLLSGTSRSHLAWLGILLGLLFLFPLGSAGIIGLVNGTLDSSPEVIHEAMIVEKYTTRSKNKTKYHVRCVSWRNPGTTISYEVGSADFNAVTPHQSKLVATTRAGALGVEWLKSRRVDPRAGP